MRRVFVVLAVTLAVVLASLPASAWSTVTDPQGDGTRAIDLKSATFDHRFATGAHKIWRVVAIRSWDRLRPLHIPWIVWQLDSIGGPSADYEVTATYQAGVWLCTLDDLHSAATSTGVTYGGPSGVGCKFPIREIAKTKLIRFRAAAAGTSGDPASLWVDLAPDAGWYAG